MWGLYKALPHGRGKNHFQKELLRSRPNQIVPGQLAGLQVLWAAGAQLPAARLIPLRLVVPRCHQPGSNLNKAGMTLFFNSAINADFILSIKKIKLQFRYIFRNTYIYRCVYIPVQYIQNYICSIIDIQKIIQYYRYNYIYIFYVEYYIYSPCIPLHILEFLFLYPY